VSGVEKCTILDSVSSACVRTCGCTVDAYTCTAPCPSQAELTSMRRSAIRVDPVYGRNSAARQCEATAVTGLRHNGKQAV